MSPIELKEETKFSYRHDDKEMENYHQMIMDAHFNRSIIVHNGNKGLIESVNGTFSPDIIEFEIQISYFLP